MARRSLLAFVAALGTAVMVGLSNATGWAPPPPLLSVESVEWLSPEPDEDGNPGVVFSGIEPEMQTPAETSVRSRPRGWVSRLFSRWRSRRQ